MKRNSALVGALVVTAVASVSTPASATTEPDSSASGFAELLSMVPADAVVADSALVVYTDMVLLWDRIGAGTDEQSRLDEMGDLAAHETFSLTPQVFGNRQALVEEARAEVGFSFFEIDRELAVMAPPRSIFIDVTSVSPQTIDAAIEADPVWSERLTRVDTDHGTYVDWGDGTDMDRTAISPFRPLGQAGQLAVLGDPATTVRTLDAADVEAVLAAADDAGESATTSDVLGPIADSLGDATVMQAFIQPGPNPFAPPINASAAQIEAIVAQAVLVQPYLGIAVVEVADGDSSRAEALLVHHDEASADANAELVETALTEGIDVNTQTPLSETFPEATVTVDGLIVRVHVSGGGSFRELYQQLVRRGLFPSA